MVYAPGTGETDPKKQNMALQQHKRQIDTNTTNIATNTANIATNTANIATLTANGPKAWVNFSGSASNGAQTVNEQFNVSGVSRTSAGVYVISFTNSFAGANYIGQINCVKSGSIVISQFSSLAAGSATVFFSVSGSGADPTQGHAVFFGS